MLVSSFLFFFFFSSRRRHTRLTCDWSSDVCSSDLRAAIRRQSPNCGAKCGFLIMAAVLFDPGVRSEERRVGKECRSRGKGKESRREEVGRENETRAI